MAAVAKTPNCDREFDEPPSKIPPFKANPCWKNPEFDDPNREQKETQEGNWVRVDLEELKNGEVRFKEQGMDAIVDCMIKELQK